MVAGVHATEDWIDDPRSAIDDVQRRGEPLPGLARRMHGRIRDNLNEFDAESKSPAAR